ncbi:hypothetical protein ACH47Z_36290 [Streptomyces sp. NPDC020192]|uniref:effector-associated constant component EACC1 n=1 Tax=Streptomyces sp. NPDC020192 TaxID=3365066 RepID=UPI0037AE76D6
MVRLQIECVGVDGGSTTRSLFQWLREDPDARRVLTVALHADTRPESMGALDVW